MNKPELPAANRVHWTCRHGVSHYGEQFCPTCLNSAITNDTNVGMRGKDKSKRKRKQS